MVNFGENSSKITLFSADFSPKLTIVSSLKLMKFNRTPSFYLRGYGSRYIRSGNSVYIHISRDVFSILEIMFFDRELCSSSPRNSKECDSDC